MSNANQDAIELWAAHCRTLSRTSAQPHKSDLLQRARLIESLLTHPRCQRETLMRICHIGIEALQADNAGVD